MPGGKTAFQTTWLEHNDCSKTKISSWCRTGSDQFHAYCTVCYKEISCDNSGLEQLLQHARGTKHQTRVQELAKQPSLKLDLAKETTANQQGPGSQTSTSAKLKMYVKADEVLKAEVLWCMQIAASNLSFRSTEPICSTLAAMFPDSLARDMQLSRTKATYIVSDGLGPHFRRELLQEVNQSKLPFVVHYDETTQVQVHKQLNVHIRYWSGTRNEVCVRFFKAFLFGHAEGQKVADVIMAGLEEEGIQVSNLLTLASDGPNVNKTIWRCVQKKLTEAGNKGLVDIGTCNIHVVHNAFHAALISYGIEIEEFVIGLHTFFKLSAARREDLRSIQLDMDLASEIFVKHVDSRWLTLGRAVKKIVRQWPAICSYFKQLQQQGQGSQPTSHAYRRIASKLQRKDVLLVQLHCIDEIAALFEEFITVFQAKEPKIHILHTMMCGTIQKIIRRFVKAELLITQQTPIEYSKLEIENAANQLSDEALVLGEAGRTALNKVPKEKVHGLCLDMRSFFVKAVTYLIGHLPLNNKLLQCLSCLQPEVSILNDSVTSAEFIARTLPNIKDDEITSLIDEWRLYQADVATASRVLDYKSSDQPGRIDHYWRTVTADKLHDGQPKHLVMSKLVKSALLFPQGNADVERGFSISNNVLTTERTEMSIDTLNGLLTTKDALIFYDPEQHLPQSVPLTKSLLQSCPGAYASYNSRMERQKEQQQQMLASEAEEQDKVKKRKQFEEEQAAEKRRRKEKEAKLCVEENAAKQEFDVGQQLIAEANEKISSALKTKNFRQISVAHTMMQQGETKIKQATSSLDNIAKQRRHLLQLSLNSKSSDKSTSNKKAAGNDSTVAAGK